ncbi:MAG: 2-amino-4-hydroxy-6-hydroxymethyldihydropteridine diphosphokinase [Bacteroides sp.]
MNYLICIGSNTEPASHLAFARRELQRRFPDVWFSPEEVTAPIGMRRNQASFINQLARLSSDAQPKEIEQQLKEIEHLAGRTPEEKALEVVRLDLDLLMADEEVLRPKDLQRDFVQQLLKPY